MKSGWCTRRSNSGMEEIAGYDFAKDASTPYYHARTISYDDAARHIDRLARDLARIVSEIRPL